LQPLLLLGWGLVLVGGAVVLVLARLLLWCLPRLLFLLRAVGRGVVVVPAEGGAAVVVVARGLPVGALLGRRGRLGCPSPLVPSCRLHSLLFLRVRARSCRMHWTRCSWSLCCGLATGSLSPPGTSGSMSS